MSAAYQLLALTEVKPGMILSDELLDRQGQVLLPKGARLTANTIALLPGHGVAMLAVLRGDGQTAADSQPHPAAIERRLAKLFRKHHPDDQAGWATGMLRRYVTHYRLEREIEP